MQVQRDAGWHEMKVVTWRPLGRGCAVDPRTADAGAWGAAVCAGVEAAEAFWWRVYVEARRRGLGTPAVRTVVVLGDGAAWIWERAQAFLGVGDVEVIEIVDIYHAYGYLWAVGNAVFGTGSPAATAWVEALKDRLYEHGAAPVLAALAALTPVTVEATEAQQAAVNYFRTHAARMDYPHFVARHLPIGSGAVESSCKCLVQARAKQAGMRWSTPGVQSVVSLRALHRSGHGTPSGRVSRCAPISAVGHASSGHAPRAPPPRPPRPPQPSLRRHCPRCGSPPRPGAMVQRFSHAGVPNALCH